MLAAFPKPLEPTHDGRVTAITYSALRAYRACPRKYYFSYVLGFRPLATGKAMRRGIDGHRGSEGYWRARQCGAPDPTAIALTALGTDMDAFELARMRPLLIGYCAAWDVYGAKVVGVEQLFQTPLRDPDGRPSERFVVQGKMDLMLQARSGAYVLTEHKFTALDPTVGSDYRRRLVIDEQIDTYWLGAESLGLQVERVGYDVIRFPTIKPLEATPPEKRRFTEDKATGEKRLWVRHRDHAETAAEFEQRLSEDIAADPSRYYERFRVDRFPEERKRFRLNLWQESTRLAHSMDHDAWPTNSDSCFRFGSPCEYFAVCAEGARIDDPMRYRRLDAPHPELR